MAISMRPYLRIPTMPGRTGEGGGGGGHLNAIPSPLENRRCYWIS